MHAYIVLIGMLYETANNRESSSGVHSTYVWW